MICRQGGICQGCQRSGPAGVRRRCGVEALALLGERVPAEIKYSAVWSVCEVVWFEDQEDPLAVKSDRPCQGHV